MGSVRGRQQAGIRKRRVLTVVLVLAPLAGGAMVAAWFWLQPQKNTSTRLDLLEAALGQFNADRYDEANAILDRRAALVAPIGLDWMLRARIAEAQARPAEAIEHLKRIPDSDPISARAWLKIGQIELKQGRARAAETAFQRSLTLNPIQIQPHRELAYIYGLQRRKTDCDAEFRALAKVMTFDYILAFSWGQNDCEIWDPNDGIRLLTSIVASDPDDRSSRLALATNFRLSNQFDHAEEALQPLAESDPDARAIRVQVAIDRLDLETATTLAKNGPADHARLNSLRGRLALQAGKAKEAAAFFRSAHSGAPNDRDPIQGLGAALQRLGDPQASEFLRTASIHDRMKRIIVECGNTNRIDLKIFAQLGQICESLGRIDQARVWYQVAIGWDPLDSEAQASLARLNHSASSSADPIVAGAGK